MLPLGSLKSTLAGLTGLAVVLLGLSTVNGLPTKNPLTRILAQDGHGVRTVSASNTTTTNTTTRGIVRRAEKGPENDHDTHISLINATPYRWRKVFNSSYQLDGWEHRWPEYIRPGQSVTVRVNLNGYGLRNRGDSAAEATYALEGTKLASSLQVQYRSGIPHRVYIQFRDELQTLNNARGTEHNLGFSRTPGGVGFVLAGREGDFISNDPPLQWMQSQLAEIGELPLREISMPRSHHAGLWKCEEVVGVAQPRNTQTHRLPLYDQLGNGGIRVLDVRPVRKHGKFRESHGSFVGGLYNGMLGATLKEMVAVLNSYMRDYPGELYIWDIHEGDARNGDHGFRAVDDDDRLALYTELMGLDSRANVSDGEDLTRRPLSYFVQPEQVRNGQSTVLIRLPASWATKKHFPGAQHGFVSGINFPLRSHWSETNKEKKMVADQIESLRQARPSRGAEMFNMDWLLTQKGAQAAFPMALESIIEMSGGAWKTLYGEGFWNQLSDSTYPNMITMDDIHGNQQKAMAMVINKCLAARRCGDLGGMVKTVPEETASSDQ